MTVPVRFDLKRALRTYVLGHDAGFDTGTKTELAEESLAREERSPAAETTTDEAGPSRAEARFGVPVPERLTFHRSASTWRDSIPGLRRGGT